MKAPLRFRFARRLLRLLLGSVFRVRAEGLERLPHAGPYLVACNHLSWVDPFILIGWLPASPRLHFLGRRSAIYNRPIKRWVLRFMGGVIPVESGDLEHLSAAVAEVLARRGVVGIFPEGGTGPEEGRLQPLRHGIAHFSARNQVMAWALQRSGGVCAQVRIRIDQEAVIARDAFKATLEIVNNSGTPLEGVIVAWRKRFHRSVLRPPGRGRGPGSPTCCASQAGRMSQPAWVRAERTARSPAASRLRSASRRSTQSAASTGGSSSRPLRRRRPR